MSLEEAGKIFVEAAAYTDLDTWYQKAALLRREDPVHLVETEDFDPFYVLTRHADVFDVERRHETFLNTQLSVLLPSRLIEEQEKSGLSIKTLVHMDAPEHLRYRGLTNDWFKPAALRRTLEARIKELARVFVDRMAELEGECDFAADVALLYPLHVIMSTLGVPECDEPRMLRLTQELFGSEDPEFAKGDDRDKVMLDAMTDFYAYFTELTEQRRAEPRQDIATVLANGTVEGEPLGELQRLSYYLIVATAGHDTTSSALGGGIEALLRRPEQMQMLREDLSLVDNAVDEILRWTTPVRHFMRYSTCDQEVGGCRIAEGERVLLSYLSANRDEDVFEDPSRFDVTRNDAHRHIAFGTGVHFCLGAHLARMELKYFLLELLPRLRAMEIAGEVEYSASSFVGGVKRMPVRYQLG